MIETVKTILNLPLINPDNAHTQQLKRDIVQQSKSRIEKVKRRENTCNFLWFVNMEKRVELI